MPPLTTRALGRRGFLGLTGGLAAAAGLGRTGLIGADAETQTIWFLDPEHGMGAPGVACPAPHAGPPSCHGCKACHAHGANKLFTSQALADATRAHLNCKCIVRSIPATVREYVMFFGPVSGPLHKDQFDRRTDQVFLPPK